MGYTTMGYAMLLVVLCLGHVALSLGEDQVIIEFGTAERHVHELLVSWNISVGYDVKHVEITNQKEDSQAMTVSGPLSDVEEYLVEDLNSDTHYEVCLKITMHDDDSAVCKESESACNMCVHMSTIRLIRDDSLIAVICTLGAILLLILVGYLCWYCAKKKAESEAEEGSEEEDTKPILIRVPPTGNGPRKSVEFEDEDIPYIDEVVKDSPATRV